MYIPAAIPPMPELDETMLTDEEFSVWEMKKLIEEQPGYHGANKYRHKELIHAFREGNPDFIAWLEHLPIQQLIILKIHRQHKTQGVPVHVDFTVPNQNLDLLHHLHFNEPAGYRTIMTGNKSNTAYIWDHNKKKIWCNMPEDTNTYIMNYTTTMHGVEPDPGRSILFFQFTLDVVKHHQLVQASVKKYPEYAVRIPMDKPYG